MNAIKLDLTKFRAIHVITNVPEIENEQEVVVKVAYAGVCGTDLHIIEGNFDAKADVTLGHEISGYVHSISDKCTLFAVGDQVVINPNRFCGSCIQCKRGMFNVCETGGLKSTSGIYNEGGWAEYCKVPLYAISKLPANLSLKQGVLCEPLSCITNALDKLSPLDIGLSILITGAGIIGLLWSCTLHMLGHRNVIVSEPNSIRREIFERLELGFKCLAWQDVLRHYEDSHQQIDVCVECSGNVNAVHDVFPLLRPGAKLCIFGVAPPEHYIKLHPYDIFRKQLSVIGVVVNTMFSFEKAVGLMEVMNDRYLDYEKLGINTYCLTEYTKALEDVKLGKFSKAVFQLCDFYNHRVNKLESA